MRTIAAILTGCVAVVVATAAPKADLPTPEKFDDTGFVSIFDGKTLDGWKISAKTGHSGKSKNKSGCAKLFHGRSNECGIAGCDEAE